NVGSSATISGTGFSASTAVTATYDGSAVTLSPTTLTNASGSFSGAGFTVPASTAGAHTVIATAGGQSASATYTATPALGPPSPTSGTVGSSVTITGSGFAGTSALSVTLGGTEASVT